MDIKNYKITENGNVEVLLTSGGRTVIAPGGDISGLPQAAQDEINAYWTPEILAAWALIIDPPKVFSKYRIEVTQQINRLRDRKKSLPILSEGYLVDPGTLSTGAMAVEMFAYSKSVKNIQTLTSSGNVATAVFAKNHHLKDGVTITVSGADQALYNVSGVVTVVDKTTATYPIVGPATSPATGSPIIALSTFRWITSDNQTVFWTADEFDEIFQACTEYLDECQQHGRDLKDAVLLCNTVAEIEAIDTTAGWPSTGV
jgi:hypothetical protein